MNLVQRVMGSLWVIVACTAVPRPASASEIRLRWNACAADTGRSVITPACDTNRGFHELVASFELDADLVGVTGIEAVLDVETSLYNNGPNLPDWWKFNSGGGVVGCRGNALSANPVISQDAVLCSDWAGGGAVTIPPLYQADFFGPTRARIRLGVAVGSGGRDLTAGQEYFAFNLRIANTRTLGADACAGCSQSVFITLESLNLLQGPTNPSTFFSGGLNRVVSWSPQVTPTRVSTWAQVKGLYR